MHIITYPNLTEICVELSGEDSMHFLLQFHVFNTARTTTMNDIKDLYLYLDLTCTIVQKELVNYVLKGGKHQSVLNSPSIHSI